MGRSTQISRTIGTQTYTTSYAYANELLSTTTYPSGRTVSVTPDSIGRLSAMGSDGSNLLTIGSYNAAGEVLGATYGNGMSASYTYNSQLQLASLVSGSSTTPVLNLTYNYGNQNNGQIQGITDKITPSQSTSYTYDELGRLKTAQTNDLTSPNTWKLQFSYDRYGNRLSEIGQAGTANMPFSELSVNPVTNQIAGLQYDAAGDVTNDGVHAYAFNARNQITQVDGAGSFVYDAAGRRVQKNGTLYIYEGSHVIAEYANGAAPNAPNVEYVGRLASFAGGSETYYYVDHLSIRTLADGSGNVIGRQTQFPFGELITGLQTGTTTKWQFTTYERDIAAGESGLDYAQARFYGSRLGRFSSLDPLSGSASNPQTLNRYSYVTNDPINLVDPTGMAGGNWSCLLNNFGDCEGGDYAGWFSFATGGMADFADPFGTPITLGNVQVVVDGQQVPPGTASADIHMEAMIGTCLLTGCLQTAYVDAPSGPDWVAPGRGDPDLQAAGCMVNVSQGVYGDMVWCPGWDGMAVFHFGGESDYGITNENTPLAFKRQAYHQITPVMSAIPPPTWGDANATCLIAAVNANNGLGGASVPADPTSSVPTGSRVYTAASRTPQLGDETIPANAAASTGAALGLFVGFSVVYAGCMNGFGF